MLGDLPCFKNDVIVDVNELNSISDVIECMIVGNDCLNELDKIDFSRFVNVRTIDVGLDSLKNVKSVMISSMMIVD